MMGRQVAQGALFYGFRLDDHVPADHLLRRIDGLFDFGFVRDALAASYSTTGRPSIDPELMLRMLLVGYLFGIRSERRLGPDGDGFDIVFSDVVMPGMGGVELAKRLAHELPFLPVILASGYSHVLAQEGAEGLELLRKPYSANQLSAALQRRIAWAAENAE